MLRRVYFHGYFGLKLLWGAKFDHVEYVQKSFVGSFPVR